MRLACLAAVAGVATAAASARAEPSAPAWHAGLNLRAELGTHPIRAGGGATVGPVRLTLVLDPMFWTDGQHDVDALSEWRVTPAGLALLAGARTTAIGITGGRHFQHKLLVGVTAPIDALSTGPLRARWGIEAATVIVKHGAGLPAEWLSLASGRDFIDLINFAMFVRFEYEARR